MAGLAVALGYVSPNSTQTDLKSAVKPQHHGHRPFAEPTWPWVVHPPQNGTIGFDPQPHEPRTLSKMTPKPAETPPPDLARWSPAGTSPPGTRAADSPPGPWCCRTTPPAPGRSLDPSVGPRLGPSGKRSKRLGGYWRQKKPGTTMTEP